MAVAPKLSQFSHTRSVTAYSAVSAIAELVTLPRNSPQLYENALEQVMQVLDVKYGSLRVINPATGHLDLMACKGFPRDYAEKFGSVRNGERTAGKIVRSRASVLRDNIQTDPSCSYLYLRREGINSLLGVPLLAREGVVGTVVVASPHRGRFKEKDMELLTAMGRVVGIAVENARLFATLKNNVDDLMRLTLRLEESDGVKDRLLSVISHELRTPVTIILGNVELLTDGIFGEVNETQKDSLQSVRRGGVNLLFQVENAIDVAQLEAGVAAIYPEPFLVDYLKDGVMELIQDEARRKQLELRWDISSKIPPLFTDRQKIAKVFRNLIDNAVKFTEKGFVRIGVKCSTETQQICCEVEDTGIGIPPSQFQVIFDPFHQMDSSHTRLYGGMGLGLRSVKKTLELLGGGIEVESAMGRGSLFRFRFPAHWRGQQ